MFWFKKKGASDRPGLEVKFSIGEQLPWKGIYFTVKSVTHEEIVLQPIGMTWKRAKQIQEAKGH